MTDRPKGVFRTRIEWVDTDAAGIYHNSTLARFVEAAEARLMTAAGIVAEYFPVAPRVTYRADYHAPLFFGQDVTTTVTLAELSRSSMHFTFETWGEPHNGAPRQLAASGSYVTVCISTEHGTGGQASSAPWPSAWVDALNALAGPSAGHSR